MENGGKNFIVYKSSAGSGKTFTLVKEYLQIILRDPDTFRHVLAITFTNKAANEMKERILKYLKSLADPNTDPDDTVEKYLLPELITNTGLSREGISARASRALKNIMHQYSDFSVSTIDSFFHKVVRTFAHDLNIPLTFEVVIDEDGVLAEVVSLLLDRVGAEADLTRVLVNFIRDKAEDERSWDIEKDLQAFSRVLTRESAIPYVGRVRELEIEDIEKARDALHTFIKSFENSIRSQSEESLKLLAENQLGEADLAGGSRGVVPWLRKFSSGNFDKLDPPKAVAAAMERNEWASSKSGPMEKARLKDLAGKLQEHLAIIIQLLEKDRARYLTSRIIKGYLYPTAVLGALDQEMENYRHDNNVLLISEFNRRIHNIVKEEPVPFIYERLGEKYRHFMVDEFQDTSILQWHNVMPLVENSLAEGKLNLVVGDGKQAIYRFRSGDVKQFERLPHLLEPASDIILQAREGALVRNFGLRVLTSNHRSRENVVGFNNRFFSRASQWLPDEMKAVYADVTQKTSGKPGGLVQLEIIRTEDDGPAYEEITDRKVLERVQELLSRNYHPRDIAVLCRDNRHASQTAAMLLLSGLRVISADSLILSFSPEVNFLVAWLSYLNNPEDDISRAHVIHYLETRGLLDQGSFEAMFLDDRRPDKWKEAEAYSRENNRRFREMISHKFPGIPMDDLPRMDLFHLSGELIRHFIPDRQPDPYLLFFQDQVLEFVRKEHHSLSDFLSWWEEKGASLSIVTPEGLDAIRVMTIHKAKGLEFPVVIYPYAHERLKLTHQQAWVDIPDEGISKWLPFAYIDVSSSLQGTFLESVYEQEHDQSMVDLLNLTYVALTRARDELYVFTAPPPSDISEPDSLPKMFSRYLVEEELWQEDQTVYAFGSPTDQSERKDLGITEDAGLPAVPAFYDWKKRVLIRQSAPESWLAADPEKSFTLGNKVHYILSNIHDEDDLDLALKQSLMEGVLTEEDYAPVSRLVRDVLTDKETAWIFNKEWQVRNEAEIIDGEGRVYRPDRLMFREMEAIVVDYKTGKPSENHMRQVNRYTGLLRDMGYAVQEAVVVYLGEKVHLIRASGDGK